MIIIYKFDHIKLMSLPFENGIKKTICETNNFNKNVKGNLILAFGLTGNRKLVILKGTGFKLNCSRKAWALVYSVPGYTSTSISEWLIVHAGFIYITHIYGR